MVMVPIAVAVVVPVAVVPIAVVIVVAIVIQATIVIQAAVVVGKIGAGVGATMVHIAVRSLVNAAVLAEERRLLTVGAVVMGAGQVRHVIVIAGAVVCQAVAAVVQTGRA
jgi:hypothetical protein